jgi:hypothetical protein
VLSLPLPLPPPPPPPLTLPPMPPPPLLLRPSSFAAFPRCTFISVFLRQLIRRSPPPSPLDGGYALRARVHATRGEFQQALVDFELAHDLAAGEGQLEESEQLFGLPSFLQQCRQQAADAARNPEMERRVDQLWQAARAGDAYRVESLLKARDAAGVLAHAEEMVAARALQSAPLFMAAQGGHAAITDRLLRAGSAVNTRWEFNANDESLTEGPTALIHVVADPRGRDTLIQVVRVLLHGGAAVEATNSDGMTAMAFAMKNGYAGVVQLLLDAGASADHVRMTTKGPWCRSLEEAVESLAQQGPSHVDVVRVLRAYAKGRAAEPPILGPGDQIVTQWDPLTRQQVPVELRAGASERKHCQHCRGG